MSNLTQGTIVLERGTTSMDPRPADWREPRADDYLGEVVMLEDIGDG